MCLVLVDNFYTLVGMLLSDITFCFRKRKLALKKIHVLDIVNE